MSSEDTNAKGKKRKTSPEKVKRGYNHVARKLLLAGGVQRISSKEGHIAVVRRAIRRHVRTIMNRARQHADSEKCGTLGYLHTRKALEDLCDRRVYLCMTRRESEMVKQAAKRRNDMAARSENKKAAAPVAAPSANDT